MNIKLSRKQELHLIQIGIDHLLNNGQPSIKATRIPWNKGRKTKVRWTPERKAKFSATMRKKWLEQKRAQRAKKAE